jgi:hypothetical protein
MKMTAEQIIERAQALKAERGVWEDHWQDITDYMLPRKDEIIRTDQAKGRKKGIELYDNTALNSAESLAGALHSLLTNPQQQWFELTTGNDILDDVDEVRLYLQQLSRAMHKVLNNSNFQTEVHELYLDLVTLGTAFVHMLEDKTSVVRFQANHIAEMFAAEGNKGFIDEIYRRFNWTARQIVQEFAPELANEKDEAALEAKVGRAVAKAFLSFKQDRFLIIHAVYRSDFNELAKKPFSSQYVLDVDKKELREGGFRTFPYLAPRWTKVTGETYGRSPGMNALPEAKTLNVMNLAMIKGAQKTVDPPLQAPDDGFVRPKRATPGAILYYRAGSNDRIQPVFNDTRLDIGIDVTRDRQARVRESFFVDQLRLREGPQMTAEEANIRNNDNRRFLSPMLGRQNSEFLAPLIERLFDIMERRNLIGEPPEILGGAEIKPKYSSALARAQRIDEGNNTLRAFQATAPFLDQNPEGFDIIDVEKVLRENWRNYGASQTVLRTREEIKQIRDARAEAQQAALERQQNLDGADVMNKVAPAAAIQQGGQTGG